MRSALKQANRRGARFVVLLGEDEIASGEPTLRDLATGEQRNLGHQELKLYLKEQLT
jgi:histidyl-tRNA synthetase